MRRGAAWVRPHTALQVKRTHFHDFMLDVHSRLRHFKGSTDPLKKVAEELAQTDKVRGWAAGGRLAGCGAERARRPPPPPPPPPMAQPAGLGLVW
jgi:hypothetical protein